MRLLSSGFSDVAVSGLMLLAASTSVKMVYNSFSVNNFPFKTLYNGLFMVCTMRSITPLCCGERSVL